MTTPVYLLHIVRFCADSKKCMKLMHKWVIPKISEEWEAVSTFLDFSIQAKNDIRTTYG